MSISFESPLGQLSDKLEKNFYSRMRPGLRRFTYLRSTGPTHSRPLNPSTIKPKGQRDVRPEDTCFKLLVWTQLGPRLWWCL